MTRFNEITQIAAREAALTAEVSDARRQADLLMGQVATLTRELHYLRLHHSRVSQRLAWREHTLNEITQIAGRARARECSAFSRLVLEHVAALASQTAHSEAA